MMTKISGDSDHEVGENDNDGDGDGDNDVVSDCGADNVVVSDDIGGQR